MAREVGVACKVPVESLSRVVCSERPAVAVEHGKVGRAHGRSGGGERRLLSVCLCGGGADPLEHRVRILHPFPRPDGRPHAPRVAAARVARAAVARELRTGAAASVCPALVVVRRWLRRGGRVARARGCRPSRPPRGCRRSSSSRRNRKRRGFRVTRWHICPCGCSRSPPRDAARSRGYSSGSKRRRDSSRPFFQGGCILLLGARASSACSSGCSSSSSCCNCYRGRAAAARRGVQRWWCAHWQHVHSRMHSQQADGGA